jgi:pyruvate,orthophosphate dikinase
LRILIDLVREGIIEKAEAVRRFAAIDLDTAIITRFEGSATPLTTGTPASSGVASGRAVFDSTKAAALSSQNFGPLILIRPDTSTADISGFAVAAGILTAAGGRTAHAAVVARQLGKPCVVGCQALTVDAAAQSARLSGNIIKEGDWVSLDG